MSETIAITGKSAKLFKGHYTSAFPPSAIKVKVCGKIVASEGRSRSARAQDRFAGSETARKPQKGESQG
ncbi:MAG: hypothetical protein ACREYE_11375 [Gammaproteobacteria bacterium]